MKLCERCFRRIPEDENYCYICKLKIENERLRESIKVKDKELIEENKSLKELRKELEEKNKYLKADFDYCNFYRRSLMKELKGQGCCCKNCFWLMKHEAGEGSISDYYCCATKWDIYIEEKRLDKYICHRYEFIKSEAKEN